MKTLIAILVAMHNARGLSEWKKRGRSCNNTRRDLSVFTGRRTLEAVAETAVLEERSHRDAGRSYWVPAMVVSVNQTLHEFITHTYGFFVGSPPIVELQTVDSAFTIGFGLQMNLGGTGNEVLSA